MKFEKLFYVIVSAALVVAFILIGYVSSPLLFQAHDGSQAKKIYYVDHISPALEKIIGKFNEKYNGQIEVVPINLPFEKFSTNERKELLTRFLRSKSDRIDIFAVDQIWVPRFVKWGISLEKYIPLHERENLLKYSMESCYSNNELIAAPLYIDIALMYYRDDLLRKLPGYEEIKAKLNSSITWEDFIALKEKMPKGEAKPYYIFQADDYEGLICSFMEMLSGQGGSIVSGDSVKLNTPGAVKAAQLLVDLVNKYHISPMEVSDLKENPSYKYFIDNNCMFLRGWPSFLREYKENPANRNMYNNLRTAPTPHFSGHKAVSVFGGWNLMISKFSSRIPESVIFINYLISREAQEILYSEGGYLPVNTSLYSDKKFLHAHPELTLYRGMLDKGIHRPFLEHYTSISDILSYYLNLAIQNKMPVKEALDKATEKVNSKSILLK
ncbi:MAG TPA: extracellular solute-binding protein [Ignavibacteriales bacterium]|nr:extracellular solute-binding protein [Ignavibacteriales bacterium]